MAPEYAYHHGGPVGGDPAIADAVLAALRERVAPGSRVLDLGCGNGLFCRRLRESGYAADGVDGSASGIEQARRHHGVARFAQWSFGTPAPEWAAGYDAVVSIEVIEHVPSTPTFLAALRAVLAPGGTAIVTTPYHGYLKNLLIALAGRSDRHYDPLWEGGHLKFFSRRTLRTAFERDGFEVLALSTCGRLPPIAKSMLLVARGPA